MARNIFLAILCCVCAALSGAAQTTSSDPQQQAPNGAERKRDSAQPQEMVQIPAGKFWMGRTQILWRDTLDIVPRAKLDNQPANLIYLDAFYIDKYEVTNAEYARYIQATAAK